MIYAASRGMLIDRVASLRDANIYERHAYRHLLGQPYIVEESNGEARSETSFMVARIMRDGTTDLFAPGCYYDAYVRDEAAVFERSRPDEVRERSGAERATRVVVEERAGGEYRKLHSRARTE